jgi:EAL domain-containing protein (putative c-di-GMP-specific phosphodiesterase class I)/FixJ family two-component response regulator
MALVGTDQWKGACVLVVDDNAPNVALLIRILRAAGIENVVGICDPREVLEKFGEVHPDLILLDLHMPHMDGFEVMASLARHIPEDDFLPIVVLTADATREASQQALSAGAKDFLNKPFNSVEVIQRVVNLLETRTLYRTVRAHNQQLADQLAARDVLERRLADQKRELHAQIKTALVPGAISIVVQPIVDLRNSEIVGVEALSRFQIEPARPPNAWFEAAAAVGLGNDLELQALGVAAKAFAELPRTVFVSLNMSAEVVLDARLARLLDDLPGDRVVVEITEHSRVGDYAQLNEALDRLRQRGVRVAVDDAGAGFSGLQQILNLRPEIIKLDIELTHGIDHDPVRRALATCLLTFANEIGATIVAEGVETSDERSVLGELGVAFGQGYFLGRPRPLVVGGSPN